MTAYGFKVRGDFLGDLNTLRDLSYLNRRPLSESCARIMILSTDTLHPPQVLILTSSPKYKTFPPKQSLSKEKIPN